MNYKPKEYWEVRGENYQVSIDTSDELFFLMEIIRDGFQKPWNTQFLEIGSGYGRIYQYLSQFWPIDFNNFTMCDFVESMRRECLKSTGILPDYWNGKTLPYSNNQFDFVISFSLLLHVTPDMINQVFSEHIRVSKKHIFIATYAGGLEKTAAHCFEHDYEGLIKVYGLRIIKAKIWQEKHRINFLLEK